MDVIRGVFRVETSESMTAERIDTPRAQRHRGERVAQPHGGEILSGALPKGPPETPSIDDVRDACLRDFNALRWKLGSIAKKQGGKPEDKIAALRLLAECAGLASPRGDALSADPTPDGSPHNSGPISGND